MSEGAKRRPRFAFVPCDNCIRIRDLLEEGEDAFYRDYLERHPEMAKRDLLRAYGGYAPLPHEEAEFFVGQNLSRCPFEGNPPLHNPIRKKYRLRCFWCGAELGCPAGVYRRDGVPLCGECEVGWYESEHGVYEEGRCDSRW